MTQILRVAMPSLPSGWRNEVFRGLTKCQAMPSEGSAVLCTTGENASETSVIREISEHQWGIKKTAMRVTVSSAPSVDPNNPPR